MATDLVVPSLGESITEAVIGRWLKKVGEPTAADEPVVDLETDKVSVQLPAPAAGVLVEQRYAAGATVKVGEVIGKIAPGEEKGTAPPKVEVNLDLPPQSRSQPHPQPAPAVEAARKPAASISATVYTPSPTPSQRRAMREGNAKPAATPAAQPAAAQPAAARPAGPVREDEELVPMTQLRRTIADRLVQAQQTAAILTTFNEIDMSAVLELRARHQEAFTAKHGVKLGFMSFFAKAVIEALKESPAVNAEIRGTDILYKKHYDIGIAVGSGRGLVVPVVRDADKLGFAELEKRIADFGQRARDNKLSLDELTGGTFTISNGGIYGSLMSTPILNFPQTGILGMHKIEKRAVVVGDDDRIVVRPMMYVALSYDHRVIDGREAVQFLVGVKDRIERPERLMFGL